MLQYAGNTYHIRVAYPGHHTFRHNANVPNTHSINGNHHADYLVLNSSQYKELRKEADHMGDFIPSLVVSTKFAEPDLISQYGNITIPMVQLPLDARAIRSPTPLAFAQRVSSGPFLPEYDSDVRHHHDKKLTAIDLADLVHMSDKDITNIPDISVTPPDATVLFAEPPPRSLGLSRLPNGSLENFNSETQNAHNIDRLKQEAAGSTDEEDSRRKELKKPITPPPTPPRIASAFPPIKLEPLLEAAPADQDYNEGSAEPVEGWTKISEDDPARSESEIDPDLVFTHGLDALKEQDKAHDCVPRNTPVAFRLNYRQLPYEPLPFTGTYDERMVMHLMCACQFLSIAMSVHSTRELGNELTSFHAACPSSIFHYDTTEYPASVPHGRTRLHS
ncbi:uncharacterized protein EDB93DRAFT_1106637 [Suillus bovinus]|uniref:uncharacterized protein n=1 Tax=Suillus bovinus TaxID=48563 RepID=UPI001B87A239|nr:uncharacterized protein EDB93DRAFT_1106637 [Suillus bovinus]KAG2137445.1 hypothetical protein EDB93DRAFT_1106637 [Suillus bovinus]